MVRCYCGPTSTGLLIETVTHYHATRPHVLRSRAPVPIPLRWGSYR